MLSDRARLTIQPFLPIVPAAGVPPVILLLVNVFRGITALARSLLLALVALVHFVLVELLGAVLVSNFLGAVPMVSMLIMSKIHVPLLGPAVVRLVQTVTLRLALLVIGYLWIETEQLGPKRGYALFGLPPSCANHQIKRRCPDIYGITEAPRSDNLQLDRLH